MLQTALQKISMVQEYMNDIQDICARVRTHTNNPPAWMIALPIMYKRFATVNERARIVDQRVYDFAGLYLSGRLPELKEYFVSNEVNERLQAYREEIENIIAKNNAADAITEDSEKRQDATAQSDRRDKTGENKYPLLREMAETPLKLRIQLA